MEEAESILDEVAEKGWRMSEEVRTMSELDPAKEVKLRMIHIDNIRLQDAIQVLAH